MYTKEIRYVFKFEILQPCARVIYRHIYILLIGSLWIYFVLWCMCSEPAPVLIFMYTRGIRYDLKFEILQPCARVISGTFMILLKKVGAMEETLKNCFLNA